MIPFGSRLRGLGFAQSPPRQRIFKEIVERPREERASSAPELFSLINAPKAPIIGYALTVQNLFLKSS
jgi:hypothetical protein